MEDNTINKGGVLMLGSLQSHFTSMVDICPTIGTTDFGLPRVVEVEQIDD